MGNSTKLDLNKLMVYWKIKSNKDFKTRDSIMYGGLKKAGTYSSVHKFKITKRDSIMFLVYKVKTDDITKGKTYTFLNADIVASDESFLPYKQMIKENASIEEVEKWTLE